MHIPDGFVSGPINVGAAVVSAATLAAALRKAGRDLSERQTPVLAVTAAFIFAAQMLNFPIAGGTSGHVLGAALATALLGPWNALIVMTLVLAIQAVLFGDGGITALGSNIVNMGVVGSFTAWAVMAIVRRLLPKTRRALIVSTSIAAWSSVVFASVACSAELAFSGTSPWITVLPAMVGVHAIIAVGEAIITAAALSVVLEARPDLVRLDAVELTVEGAA